MGFKSPYVWASLYLPVSYLKNGGDLRQWAGLLTTAIALAKRVKFMNFRIQLLIFSGSFSGISAAIAALMAGRYQTLL
jgi:hypothetical protein